jgi:ubiquitin-conjugating enzyme E2 variant
MVVGILIADFTSGFVHWLCDTWGSPSTPIVGALAIRTFREHHVDQKAILRHDFVETNGHNCALSVVLSGAGLHAQASTFVTSCLLSGAFFVAMTSQIHKWAHMDRAPLLVRALQRMRLILPPQHHSGHHAPPHIRNYCITAGWLDRPLHMLRFFETLEIIIRVVTGARPRQSRS